ncbi:ABC transporter ATP-binding protein [Marinobacter halodurans]|nr:ABC transporter ATP-binding protein [Marinobacter halodurans]
MEPKRSYRDLWQLIRTAKPSARMLLLGATLSIAGGLGMLAYPLVTKHLIDALNGGGIGVDLTDTIAVLVLVVVGASVVRAAGEYVLSRIGYQIVAELRHALTGKILALPVSSFDEEETGDRVSRVIGDCQTISGLATGQFVGVIRSAIVLIGSIVVLALLDLKLTMIMLTTTLLAFLIILSIVVKLEPLAKSVQGQTAKLSSILTQIFSEIRLVKAFTAEHKEKARCKEVIDSLTVFGCRNMRIISSLEPIRDMALIGCVLIILIYGGTRIGQSDLSVGTLTAFILYIFNIVTPLGQLSNFAAELQRAKGASRRIAEILREQNEYDVSGRNERPASDILEFRDVCFSYKGGRAPVLRGVDLRIEPGTTTALVGRTGSGKTTILSLIERFYVPVKGEITFGGKPITDIDLMTWRKSIGYVSQAASVIPGSVRDNITYGLSRRVSEKELRSAAEKAGALSFILDLPQGFDSMLIEQGNNLSGGQRQRIAIARVFLRNPDFLILDEATSSLDGETEHVVRTALKSLMEGRTNIVVAHRLYTITQADRIYYLEDGEVAGAGTHKELLCSQPGYASLVEHQFQQVREKESA